MKSATKHADELKALQKRLMKERKPAPRQKIDPLIALVRGAMLFDVSDTRADEAMKVISKEFVDLNELRVATELEVQDLLGVRYPQIEKRVSLITTSLSAIFEKEHTLKLDRLGGLNRKEARQFLRDLPGMHPFVDAYVMLMAFDAPCVPIDDQMLYFLKNEGVLEADTSLEEAQKFLEHHVKAEEIYDVFSVVRDAAMSAAEEGTKKKKK